MVEGDSMPQFMSKTPAGTGYLFRRGVPEDVRHIVGKREFKQKLAGDYRAACRECDRLAYETSRRIEAARDGLQRRRQNPFHVYDDLIVIGEVTPDLAQRFYSTVLATTDLADIQRREAIAVGQERGLEMDEVQDANKTSEALLRQAFATGDCSAFRHVTHQTLHLNGYRLADELLGSTGEAKLLLAFVRAHLAGIGIVDARFMGEDPPVVLPAAPLHSNPANSGEPPAPGSGPMMLSNVVRDFIANLPVPQRAMKKKHELVLPAFQEVVGDMPITQLRQSHVKDFLLTVQKLPPRWAEMRRKGKLTIREMAKTSWDTCIAAATYEGSYRASLHTFIESAKRNWQDIGFPTTLSTDFSYEGKRTKAEFKQRALRLDEITLIFFHERMEKIIKNPAQVHKFWLLAIELYTGARVREICQINPQSDYGSQGGIRWLRLTDEPGATPDPDVLKSVKTQPRTIPMHPELVRIGLPQYLDQLKASGARRLFPQWAPTDGNAGAAPAKSVANYLRYIGLHGVANEIGNAVRGSHAFRHTLLTHGKRNHVNLRCISGHQESTDNAVADGYEDETILLTLATMAERLAKLDYGVSLPVPVLALIRPAQRQQSQGGARKPQPRAAGTGRGRQRSGP